MCKRYLNSVFITFCVFFIILMSACHNSKPQIITELNQTYRGSVLEIVATDIKTTQDPIHDDEIIISVRFEIKNISKDNVLVNSTNFFSYVDDVTVSGSTLSNHNKAGEEIGGYIAPGKFAKGYYEVNVSKDARELEIQVEENYLKESNVSFIFSVPPLEEEVAVNVEATSI